MVDLERLVEGARVVAVVCNQFGDSGKGKVSDMLAPWADAVARGTGGANAGHSVVTNGKEVIYHLLPTSISYDREGVKSIIGQGVMVDPDALYREINDHLTNGGSCNHLTISENASVVLPHHLILDQKNKSQKSGGIGTTGRGMGPAYADRVSRKGILIQDLFSPDVLASKLAELQGLYPHLSWDTDKLIVHLTARGKDLEEFIGDTTRLMHDMLREGKKIVLEGAQGLFLSIDHGVPPYVTSSDCSVNGTANGVGISARSIDLVLGLSKFPFMTRVGGGSFPTELGGKHSQSHCAETDVVTNLPTYRKVIEGKMYGAKINELLNSKDDFLRGVGIRLAANEYGATTGRPRRVGWTDTVASTYATTINGPLKLVLTKLDSVAGMEDFKICVGYELPDGSRTAQFPRNPELLKKVKPIYETYTGYRDISGAQGLDDLPSGLRTAIEDFSIQSGAPIGALSVGREAHQTIII